METIRNYLDNIFLNLPKTSEIEKLKNDLLSNMEDKYNELKNSGKSENEAIGIVITEFGNIDEIIDEFGIKKTNRQNTSPFLTEDQVKNYLVTKKKSGKLVGIGVFLCILAPAVLILINELLKNRSIGNFSKDAIDMFGMIPFFILIAIAVGLFIYSGTILEKFKYIDNGFQLPTHIRASIQEKSNKFNSSYTISLIIGVALCILSPIIIFVTSTISYTATNYGVVVLLIMISIAVYIFIYFGTIKSGYENILKFYEYSKMSNNKKEQDKVISVVSSIVWSIATCIFLISGLVFHKWEINWIIFPITGILFAMFSQVYTILKGKETK